MNLKLLIKSKLPMDNITLISFNKPTKAFLPLHQLALNRINKLCSLVSIIHNDIERLC